MARLERDRPDRPGLQPRLTESPSVAFPCEDPGSPQARVFGVRGQAAALKRPSTPTVNARADEAMHTYPRADTARSNGSTVVFTSSTVRSINRTVAGSVGVGGSSKVRGIGAWP